MIVPPVLTNGHHANILKWQKQQAIEMTQKRRPDLWTRYCEMVDRSKTEKNI
jgi:tRNA (guanine37-N1)-methyltransferase